MSTHSTLYNIDVATVA